MNELMNGSLFGKKTQQQFNVNIKAQNDTKVR